MAITPLDITDVSIDDEFWNERRAVNRTQTLEFEYEQLVETGRIENFEQAADPGNEGEGGFNGRFFNDSDVYKWIEAVSYVLSSVDDEDLRRRLDEVVEIVAAAQEDDGYLNTYFTLEEPEKKWTNLGMMHELYCAGHLFEAAVAHHEATGETTLLDVATDFADHIDDQFGPEPEKDDGIPGHEEIELALVRLYRTTGEERYLELAAYFVDQRGRSDSRLAWELDHLDEIAGHDRADQHYRELYGDHEGNYNGEYGQDHAPVREQDSIEGHAVRATYLYTAVTMLSGELGDDSLLDAAERVWTNMAKKRMYVTGAIGSWFANEGFSRDYDLPNDLAYAETCAAIGNVFWNHQLALTTGEGKYADTLERVLYNGFLSGVGLDGEHFRYVNALESNGEQHPLHSIDPGRFSLTRQEWFETACCPPNAARLLASLERYVYAEDDRSLYVNLLVSSEATCELGGTEVRFDQDTDYPWDGGLELAVDPDETAEFAVRVRSPSWADDETVTVDGEPVDASRENGYVVVDRTWESGDTLRVDFDIPVQQIEAHPAVQADAAKVALRRGPIVYCVEEADNDVPPHSLRIPADADFDTAYDADLFDGVVTVSGSANAEERGDWDEETLYRPRNTSYRSTEFTAIPYYAWGSRGKSEMRVWLPAE